MQYLGSPKKKKKHLSASFQSTKKCAVKLQYTSFSLTPACLHFLILLFSGNKSAHLKMTSASPSPITTPLTYLKSMQTFCFFYFIKQPDGLCIQGIVLLSPCLVQ